MATPAGLGPVVSGVLAGQTVVVIGGSSGTGLETARRARAESAEVVLAARDPERLDRAAKDLGALSMASFDATDFDQLNRFFAELQSRKALSTSGGVFPGCLLTVWSSPWLWSQESPEGALVAPAQVATPRRR